MFVSIFRDAVEFYMHQKLKNGFEIRSSVKNVFVDLYLIFHCWIDSFLINYENTFKVYWCPSIIFLLKYSHGGLFSSEDLSSGWLSALWLVTAGSVFEEHMSLSALSSRFLPGVFHFVFFTQCLLFSFCQNASY